MFGQTGLGIQCRCRSDWRSSLIQVCKFLISSQSLNLHRHGGTTDDIATILFHLSLSSAALRESPNSIPVHSLMLSSHFFFCLPFLLVLSLSPEELSLPCNITILQGPVKGVIWRGKQKKRWEDNIKEWTGMVFGDSLQIYHSVCILRTHYRKFPKYSDTQNICCNCSKIWTMWLYHRAMSPNDADGMANSVHPDQTAPLGAVWSGSALFAQTYLSENLGSLQYSIFRMVTAIFFQRSYSLDFYSLWKGWLVVLVFYGPSTLFRSFRTRSVNLSTLFLGKPPRQFTST